MLPMGLPIELYFQCRKINTCHVKHEYNYLNWQHGRGSA